MNKSGTSELCARLRELAAQHPRYGYRRSDALGNKLPAWAVGLAKSPPDNSFDSFTRPNSLGPNQSYRDILLRPRWWFRVSVLR